MSGDNCFFHTSPCEILFSIINNNPFGYSIIPSYVGFLSSQATGIFSLISASEIKTEIINSGTFSILIYFFCVEILADSQLSVVFQIFERISDSLISCKIISRKKFCSSGLYLRVTRNAHVKRFSCLFDSTEYGLKIFSCATSLPPKNWLMLNLIYDGKSAMRITTAYPTTYSPDFSIYPYMFCINSVKYCRWKTDRRTPFPP